MINSRHENRHIAETIAAQMGGVPRLQMFADAKSFMVIERGLSFCVKPVESMRPNLVEVTLNYMDTYDLSFKRIKSNRDVIVVKEVKNVYCDQLMDIFEENTGLFLTFYPRKSA